MSIVFDNADSMTRIALIAGTYAPDRCGVAHYTDRLRQSLHHRGIQSTVLTTIDAATDSSVLGVVKSWNLQALLPLARSIHRTDADILHIQHAAGTYGFDRAIFLLPLLLRLTGWQKPIVTTVHEYGWWEWQPKWISQSFLESIKQWGQQREWWDREDGFLLTQSNAIITTNSDAEKVIVDRLPNFKNRVRRIAIGANVEVAKIERVSARKKLLSQTDWSEDAIVLAFFGFLHPVKGLELLLSAFQQVQEIQPKARLILIGGVESLALRGQEAQQYWNKLKDIIREYNLEHKAYMTGYVDAETASHYLSGSDIGVLPFHHGVTLKSGSLLALMAHGLPVIATQANHQDLNADLIQPIPARDRDALTTALIQLLNDPIAQRQLAEAGRSFSRSFNWDTIADAHLAVYDAVLSQPAIDYA